MKKFNMFLLFSFFIMLSFRAKMPFEVHYKQFYEPNIQTADTIKWIAPESANALVNPFANDEEIEDLMMEAELPYRKHCRSCHGRLGDGKGSGAEELKTIPTDFTQPDFLKQSDGSIYWKIAEGRDEMEPYKEKLSEEEIWALVIYIKAFSNK